jgi:hypothetical protein
MYMHKNRKKNQAFKDRQNEEKKRLLQCDKRKTKRERERKVYVCLCVYVYNMMKCNNKQKRREERKKKDCFFFEILSVH